MSADRQRLVGAIRRMAKTDPDIANAIDATKNRGGFDGEGARGESTGANAGRICCDGSTSGSTNPGTSSRNPDGEGAGQDAGGGLDPNDPANLDMGAGSLTGLTDCSTGEPICFDGSGFIPPDGWDAPDQPGIIEGYEEGYFWVKVSGIFGVRCSSASLTLAGCKTSELSGVCTKLECGATGSCLDEQAVVCNPTEEDLTAEAWPSDGCVNLAVKGGTIVGSKYDPDQSGAYSKPMSEINLCDGNGNQITLAPSADGGWKTIDAINGGDGYLYDSSGKQIARISGDEFSDPTI